MSRAGDIVLTERTPDAKRAYAAGLRMACEIVEWRMDSLPWWLRVLSSPEKEARAAIASLRQSADLIERTAEWRSPRAIADSQDTLATHIEQLVGALTDVAEKPLPQELDLVLGDGGADTINWRERACECIHIARAALGQGKDEG
jgi:hypothetical protein